MKQFRKRFLAFVLSFIMILLSMGDMFTAYAGPPALKDDPDILSNVTYDAVAIAARGNSDYYVGEEVPFYANITMSSATRSLPGAYSKLYLPKAVFANVGTSNISTWINRPDSNFLDIDSTSNSEYHVVTMKYRSLAGGTTQTVPFKAQIKEHALANNETYVIPWQVYDANDTLLESTNNTFTAKTYPIGYTSETYNYTRYYSFLQGSSDLQNNTTLSNDFSAQIDFYSYRTDWPAAGTFHGTTNKSIGADRRKTRVSIKIPANASLDTANTYNAGWQYNAATSTLWKDILYSSYGASSNYTYVKFNNQPVGTNAAPVTVEFPITWQYVNDDGSLDAASLEKSKAFIQFTSYPGTPPTDSGLNFSKSTNSPWVILLGAQDTSVHSYTMSAGWSWSSGNPSQYPALGTYHHTIKTIEDTPEVDMDFISYTIKYSNNTGYVMGATGPTSYESVPVLSAAQQAALSQNKLIGTKADGSTEIIATNVSITAASTEVTLPAPKHYKKIELKFDNPIEIQAPGNAIYLTYKFRLEQGAYNNVKAQLAPKPNNASSYVETYNKATLYGDTATTLTGRDYARWTKEYVYESDHYTQNRNIGTKYIDEIVQVNDDIRYYYNLGDGGRDLKNPKYYVLVDPGFEYQSIDVSASYTPEITPAVLSNYRVEYNFKNTGKTAYIWDLPDINIPAGNSSTKYINFYPKFKFTRNVTAGPGTIDTYFEWDNNEEAPAATRVPGLYADTLDLDNDGNTTEKFSSKKENYIYSPPLELILTKRSKRADAAAVQYSSITTPDSEQVVDYQLNIFNNSITAVSGFTFFDILPHVGDKSIAPDQRGNYADRGSTYKVTLTGPVDTHPNYIFEYSTTPVTEGNIAANYTGATWTSTVTDWSAVTMFRAKMKPGYSLGSHNTDTITFKAKMPDTVPLDTTDKAVNTFAGFSGDSYTGAFEALANTVVPKKYKISGKIYYDIPPVGGTGNGTYLTADGDAPAIGRTVALYKSDGTPVIGADGNPVTTIADNNGDYSFDNIARQGTYKVVVTPGVGDTLSGIHVTSTSLVVGNDFNNGTLAGNPVFEASVTVTPSNDKKTANAALEATNSTLKIKYVDTAGNPIPLDDGSGNVADTDSVQAFRSAYTVTPQTTLTGVTNFEYLEPDLTNGRPLTGTLNPGQNVVILKYKRKTAGDITVHHYEVGQNTELYTPAGAAAPSAENFSGTEKLGLTENLTNKAADITNFEYASIDVSGASSPTAPTSTGATTLTYKVAPQTVTYFYKRKDAANITVHHYEDGTTTELYKPAGASAPAAVTISGTGKLGLTEDLTNKAADIPNYDYVGVDVSAAASATAPGASGETTLTHGNTAQTVIYKYKRKDAGDVIVHHYEQGTTTQLVPDMTLGGTGKLGLPYTTNTQTIPNFTVVTVPANQNGTFQTGNQTVTYYYKRNDAGNVLVHHYENGTTNSVSPDENLSGVGKIGLTYTTSPATVANFTVVNATPTDHSGNYPATGTVVVTYYYTRNDAGNVIVKHLEQGSGTQLDTDDVLNGAGKLGLPYTTSEKNIATYELVAQPVNKNGTFATGTQTVIYEYRRMVAGDVTTVYVDDEGNQIDTPDVQSGIGKLGLPYTTSAKTIPNFTLVSTPLNATGIFVTGPQTVTYVYRRSDAGNVTVYHKSKYDNSDLSAPTVLDGTRKLGLPYTTSPETYSDYEIDTVPANATGTFASGAQTVTYLYKRKTAAGVRVNYLDNHGNSIETPDDITGTENVGLPYTTSPKTIPYYDLITVPTNANGVFSVAPITVDYIYKRQDAGNVVIEHLDENGNVPLETPEVLDGTEKLGMPYTSSVKSFDNFDVISVPTNANGTFVSGSQTVTYVYRRKDAGNVIARYLNTAGLPIESDEILDGTRSLGLPYATTEKAIAGYSLYLIQGANTGIFTTGEIVVTYIYRKDPSAIIIPGPLTPVTPVNPSVINPVTPSVINPSIPVNPSNINPSTPVNPNPSRIATPSQINIPGRDQDIIIRPTATPSTATPSNIKRGGSSGGSSGGNSVVRPGKTVTVNDINSKGGVTTPEPVIDKPVINTDKTDTKKIGFDKNQRKALAVPKTADERDVRGYMFILMSSIAAAMVLALKKKEER